MVRDFLHDEALGGEDKVLAKYLKPDLLIIDDMGMKQLPKRSGESRLKGLKVTLLRTAVQPGLSG